MSSTTRRVLLYSLGSAIVAVALYLGYGYKPAPDPSVRLNGAAMLGGMGQYEQAIAICDQVIEEHSDNLEARIYKATFLAADKRLGQALAAYDDALDHVVDDESMRRNLIQDRAGVLLSLGRLDEFRSARQTLAAAGEDYRVHVLDGLAAKRAGDLDGAVEAYSLAVSNKPDDEQLGEQLRARLWHALMEQGDAAVAKRDFETARLSYDRACPLFETAFKAHLKAAEVRLALDEPGPALAVLGTVAPKTPGLAPLAFRAATTLLERDKTDAAVEALALAIRADRAGTRTLFDKTPAWSPLRRQARVIGLWTSEESGNSDAGDGDSADTDADESAAGVSDRDTNR